MKASSSETKDIKESKSTKNTTDGLLFQIKSLFQPDFIWVLAVFVFYIGVQFVFPALKHLFIAGYLQ